MAYPWKGVGGPLLYIDISERRELHAHGSNITSVAWGQKFGRIVGATEIRVGNEKLFFLFRNQNICFRYSKELSHWEGSFEHPKHWFKLMDKKIIPILCWNFLLE